MRITPREPFSSIFIRRSLLPVWLNLRLNTDQIEH
jgi:hypothetical protein